MCHISALRGSFFLLRTLNQILTRSRVVYTNAGASTFLLMNVRFFKEIFHVVQFVETCSLVHQKVMSCTCAQWMGEGGGGKATV